MQSEAKRKNIFVSCYPIMAYTDPVLNPPSQNFLFDSERE